MEPDRREPHAPAGRRQTTNAAAVPPPPAAPPNNHSTPVDRVRPTAPGNRSSAVAALPDRANGGRARSSCRRERIDPDLAIRAARYGTGADEQRAAG